MADYPCDVHNARYAGPSTRLYLNVFTEDATASFRFSVCPNDLALLLNDWLGKALHQTAAGHWDPPVEGETLDELLQPSSRADRRLGRR